MPRSFTVAEFIAESTSHIFNPGAPAWGVDWCPIHHADRHGWHFPICTYSTQALFPGRSYTQYLAVAPFPTAQHSPDIGVKVKRPAPACIQIWTLSSTQPGFSNTTDAGVMQCVMVLCINSGAAHDLKWCPLPSHDSVSTSSYPRWRPPHFLDNLD